MTVIEEMTLTKAMDAANRTAEAAQLIASICNTTMLQQSRGWKTDYSDAGVRNLLAQARAHLDRIEGHLLRP